MATKKSVPQKGKKNTKQTDKPVKKSAAGSKSKLQKASKSTYKPVAKKSVPVKKTAKEASAKKSNIKPGIKSVKPVGKQINNKKKEPKPNHTPVSKSTKHAATSALKPSAKKPEPVKEIKIPKTTIKTSVPYHPEYKPLEQRKGNTKNNEPLVRYNDADLTEFRDLIHGKMERAKKELAYLQGLITRKDEMGGDEAESRYMTMEDGSMSMEREQLSQMASRQITYIDHLEKALIRIENKTYGICRVTGRLIDKARLRAVPHATLSLEAKLGIVKTNEQ
ncbi:MAG: TraR/DksA C4-type zinc finger protein [Chitinophagaceae bacterium]